MKKIRKVISEIHLYSNKIEAFIKILFWIISWFGGICPFLELDDKSVLGGAYFIYSLSLLMEFAPGIIKKGEFLSKLFHTLFCFVIALICLLSVGILLGVALSDGSYFLISILSKIVVGYMVVDIFLLWTVNEERTIDILADKEEQVREIQEVFNEKLVSGSLGNVAEGENING